MHYQFETLHPMRDGNGRMGRLLMAAMMSSEGLMTCAMPPISEYLFSRRNDYQNSLYGVSARDDFETWFSLFLDAVAAESERSVRMIDDILTLRERMMNGKNNRNRIAVMDSLFDNPYIMVSDVMAKTGLTRPGALKLMSAMEQDGIVQEISGRQRGKVYLSKSIRKAEYGM